MQRLKIPETPVLSGETAKKALYDYIIKTKGEIGTELSEQQGKVMIKFARGLISAIESENCDNSKTCDPPNLFSQIKTSLKTRISSKFSRTPNQEEYCRVKPDLILDSPQLLRKAMM